MNSVDSTSQGKSKGNLKATAYLPGTRLLWGGAVAFFLIIVSWVVYAALSGKNGALQEVDLKVYWDGGLIVRHVTPYYNSHYYDPLYMWGGTGKLALKFTYTPFAAIAFALISFIPLTALYSVSVVVNMITFAAALWFTFYGLGYRDRRVRLGATLLAAAATFWLQPVVRTIYLGQINLILMAAIMWDLTQPDYTKNGKYRWWKGVATGIAAGIKLTPLIFIPYLLVARKWREAAGCVAGFLGTVAVGFIILPHDSSKWWLHGAVISDGNRTGFAGWAGDQSLHGLITRLTGSIAGAQTTWLDCLRARRHSRHRRRLPARPGRLPRARDPGHRADRPARLADLVGPPLGLDRARGRRRRPLRDRRVAARGQGRRGLARGRRSPG